MTPGDGVEVKRVQQVMDEEALLPYELMELGKWVAGYYCAPLGEALRGTMPLTAEVRRQWVYRIGELGRRVLYEGAAKGSSRRSKLSVEDQSRQYAVYYLESGEAGKTQRLAISFFFYLLGSVHVLLIVAVFPASPLSR